MVAVVIVLVLISLVSVFLPGRLIHNYSRSLKVSQVIDGTGFL